VASDPLTSHLDNWVPAGDVARSPSSGWGWTWLLRRGP